MLGHSQGTIVGTAMALRRPDLFRAYVGTGQIVDLARNEPVSYQLAVTRAQASGRRKAARELARIGAPPYPEPRTDVYRFNSAIMFYPQPLYDETMSWTSPRTFDVPVHLLHGDGDQHTLTSLVEEYYQMVEAPAKNLVLLPGGGHCAVLMQPAAFLAELRACVGRVVNGAPAGTSDPGSC